MVIKSKAKSGKNAHNPAAYMRKNAIMAPMKAPPSLTDPKVRASTAKITEMIAAGKALA